jgi:acetylornithine deacetylase/succinyl-diaminopimelate desuccinylase-like protein
VTGKALERVGVKVVADGALFAAAGIPTVYHGPVGSGAHADEESMPVDELVRAARTYVALLERVLA